MDFGSSSSSRFPFENRRHFEPQQELDQQQQDQEIMECNNSIFVEKEHMFDKVVTPSDVGKLNRLVIPKQHAEKYFPLDSSSNEKGLLLNFEDRSGKSWRFRYSYWTSSQSYVMTKGWSRFVKEKRLDAGDIVSFQRGVGDVGKDRFFIDWRRRPPHAAVETAINFHHHGGGGGGGQIPHHFQVHQWATPLSLHRDHVLHLPQNNSNHNNVSLFHNTNNPYWNNHHYPHHHHHHRHHRPNHPVVGAGGGGGSYGEPSVFYHLRSAATVTASEVVPVAAGGGGGGHGIIGKGAAAKTLRLFGVDMECAVSEESDDECDITTSTTTMSSSPQFRIYNGMPMSMPMPVSMSMSMQMQMQNDNNNVPTTDFFEKGKSSMSSLDFGT